MSVRCVSISDARGKACVKAWGGEGGYVPGKASTCAADSEGAGLGEESTMISSSVGSEGLPLRLRFREGSARWGFRGSGCATRVFLSCSSLTSPRTSGLGAVGEI